MNNIAAPLGIDTIKLFIPTANCRFAGNCAMRIITPYNHQPMYGNRKNRVLWINEEGQRQEGIFAYWRGNGVNVNIRPFRFIGEGSVGVFISFSVAGFYATGDNFHPLDASKTEQVFEQVQNLLAGIGITTDIRVARLSRLDLFKNLVLESPCSDYLAILDALHPPRMEKMPFMTGQTHLNKNHQFAIYDKITERRIRGRETTSALPPHVLRIEYRMMKAAKIKSVINCQTVGDLLGSIPELEPVYSALMQRYFFRLTADELRLSSQQALKPIENGIRKAVKACRGSVKNCRIDKSEWISFIACNDIQRFSKELRDFGGMNRHKANRIVRDMKQAVLMQAAISNQKFTALYGELATKVGVSKTAIP